MTAERELAAVALASGIAPHLLLRSPVVLEHMIELLAERSG